MASGLVIHISAGGDTHTEVLSHDRIRIGTGEDCDLRLRASSMPSISAPSGAMLELARTNGHYQVADFDGGLDLKHNGRPMERASKIVDGDEVRVGASDIALQFFPVRSLPAVISTRQDPRVAPFIEHAAIEAAATPPRDDAKIFLRSFTRELVREINPSTKIITLALALSLVGGILYLGFAMFKEIQSSRRLINDQKDQISLLRDLMSQTDQKYSNLDQSNQRIIESLSLAPKLRREYGSGVCLLYSSYVFVESGTGRPLRYQEMQMNEEGVVLQNGNETPQLTPEGRGAVAEFESVGTGFHVGDGYVVTNRHVAQPWLADEQAQSLSSSVSAQPRLKKLIAYFPDNPQPILLKFRLAAQNDDVAVCTFEVEELPSSIPTLPVEKDSDAAAVGKTVVMMGYPNGPDRLLALRDDAEQRMIQARCGSSIESLLGCLSQKNRIQPLTTQGSITDLDLRRIVYDARTAEGGSGAPLFGNTGRVIGVNFAVYTQNSASNFAVPIRYAQTLLQRAGWKLPEPPESNKNDNSNTAPQQPNQRGNAPASSNSQR